LADHVLKIERDFKVACSAFCVPMPGFPDLQRRIWKYDIGSSDLKKHARECFRLIVILDDASSPNPEIAPVIMYHKSDIANLTAKDIAKIYLSLDAHDDDEEMAL
jgi:hypothetical protein